MHASILTKESLSLEFQVMLAGLQAHLKTAPEPDWIKLLTPALDWQQVLGLCQYHEVTPLVYESLSKHAARVPAETLSSLKQQVIKDKKKSLHLAGVLQGLLAIFEREGVEVLPYKGIVLSQQMFGDIAKRPTKDLDIAVQRKDYFKAKSLLMQQGFEGPFTALHTLATPQQEKLILQSSHHHVFYGHHTKLELHFEVMPPSGHKAFTLQELWNHLEHTSFHRHSIRQMTTQQLLLVLSTHAAIHYWKRLKWLFDSAIVLDQSQATLDQIQQARVTGREMILLSNLWLCHIFFGLPWPGNLETPQPFSNRLQRLYKLVSDQYKTWPHAPIRGWGDIQGRILLSDSPDVLTLHKLLWHKLVDGGYHFFSLPKIAYIFFNPLRLFRKYIKHYLKI